LLVIRFFFFLLLHSCSLSDSEWMWYGIRIIFFSSLVTRPPSTVSISDDEQITPFRIYNSRVNSTPINTHETHRSTVFATVHPQRCFHEQRLKIALTIHMSTFLSLYITIYFVSYPISAYFAVLYKDNLCMTGCS
jgi:hypothetical protein